MRNEEWRMRWVSIAIVIALWWKRCGQKWFEKTKNKKVYAAVSSHRKSATNSGKKKINVGCYNCCMSCEKKQQLHKKFVTNQIWRNTMTNVWDGNSLLLCTVWRDTAGKKLNFMLKAVWCENNRDLHAKFGCWMVLFALKPYNTIHIHIPILATAWVHISIEKCEFALVCHDKTVSYCRRNSIA